MFHPAIICALVLFVVTATVNLKFAASLALGDDIEFAFWSAIGLAAATYTALAFGLIATQRKLGNNDRAVAAAVLFVIMGAYDVFAGYSVSRHQQQQADRVLADRAEAEARLAAFAGLASTPVLAVQHQAALALATPEQCAEATGENRLSRAAADRIRAVCARQDDTALALARGAERDRLAAHLAALPDLADDPRVELFGPVVAAWLPVLVVSLGSVLGTFAAVTPRQVVRQAAPPSISNSEPPAALEAAPAPVALLRRVVDEGSAHEAVTVDQASRSIAGTQRRLAALVGVPVAALNRALAKAQSAGLVEVLTSRDGTAVRFAS